MTTARETFTNRFEWLLAIITTAIALALNVYLLVHAGGFCGDEVQVINLAGTHSLSAMTHDSFPVLLPVLVKVWTAIGFGAGDIGLRLLGTLIAAGMSGALWIIAWRARRSPPVLSIILFGLNGFAIYWANYLRAYGLGSLLILLVIGAMVSFLSQPTWKRSWILAATAILSVQALFHNAVFVAAICAGGWMISLLRKDKDAALKILITALLAAASLLPYWNSISRWQQGIASFRPGFSLAAATDNLHTMLAFPLPQHVWLWGLLGLATLVLGAAVVPNLRMAQRFSGCLTFEETKLFAAVVLLLSWAGYGAFLRFAGMITSPWYFLPLMAVTAICFDLSISIAALMRLPSLVVTAILLATACISIPFAIRDLNCRFTNADLIARKLMEEASPQDYIVVTPWHLGISFNRYYHGTTKWDTLPPLADHATYRFDLLPAAPDMRAAEQPVLNQIGEALQAGRRVWLVGWITAPEPGKRAHSEISQFIADHSQSFEAVPADFKGAINDYEDESLLLASGWRRNGQTNSSHR